MPRAKNDAYKRKAAQAVNHLAAAILDVYEIHNAFEPQLKMLQEQEQTLNQAFTELIEIGGATEEERGKDPAIIGAAQNRGRYEVYVQDLYNVMMGISATREHILLFTGNVWGLDEESIKVYMG